MVPLGLADRLSLARAAGSVDSLHVAGGPDSRTVLDPAGFDSVLRGIAEARRAVGRGAETFPLAARLEKRIPIAAGLAGGSSDAAAAIDGALEAWGAELGTEERRSAAAAAGSDVPFFLAGGPALVEGRGERVRPLPGIAGEPPGVLLVTPGMAASTRDVFAAFDADPAAAPAHRGSTRQTSEHLAAEMGPGHAPMRAAGLVGRAGVLAVSNDLASAADLLVPGLRALRRALTRLLGVPIGLSGSGPTLWALYPALGGAEAAAGVVREALDRGTLDVPGTVRHSSPRRLDQPQPEARMNRHSISTGAPRAPSAPTARRSAPDAWCSARARSVSTRRPASSSTAASRRRPSAP
jgi:4-diphosphocytidyl-2-C-methyl-D-erythritol kinase